LAQWAIWNIFAISFVAMINNYEKTQTGYNPEDPVVKVQEEYLGTILLIFLVSLPIFSFMIGLNDAMDNRFPRYISRKYQGLMGRMNRTREHHV
jgi:hypothetical protein